MTGHSLDKFILSMLFSRLYCFCLNPTHPACGHPLCFEVSSESNFSKEGKEGTSIKQRAPLS